MKNKGLRAFGREFLFIQTKQTESNIRLSVVTAQMIHFTVLRLFTSTRLPSERHASVHSGKHRD